MKPKDFLSDAEIAKVMAFNQDEVLVGAVRKILLATIYENGTLRPGVAADPLRNSALGLASLAISGKGVVSNEDLGADIRGLMQGISLLENGLNYLSKVKTESEDGVDNSDNEAI